MDWGFLGRFGLTLLTLVVGSIAFTLVVQVAGGPSWLGVLLSFGWGGVVGMSAAHYLF